MRTLVKALLKGLVFAASLVLCLWAFFLLFRPFPDLARGLPSARQEAELERRVTSRFRLGTQASVLENELVREGWGPVGYSKGFHSVWFERWKSPISSEAVGIRWTEADGLLTEVHAFYRRSFFVP